MKDPKRQISGSQPQNLNHTSDAQEVQQAGEREITYVEGNSDLAKVKGVGANKIQFVESSVRGTLTTFVRCWKIRVTKVRRKLRSVKNEIYRIYKSEEEICIVKNEIYQVVGFFSAFQDLLITAAAQSNLLRCNNAGFVLALSAFATAVAVLGIVQKDIVLTDLRRGTSSDKRGMEVSPYNIFSCLL
jgi:hypothetical protein